MGALGGTAMFTGTRYNTFQSFWVKPQEPVIQPYNASAFKFDWTTYINKKSTEYRWWKITWLPDKEAAWGRISQKIDLYETYPTLQNKQKLLETIKEEAISFGGLKLFTDPANGSDMSKLLMQWYWRLQNSAVPQNMETQRPSYRI